MRNWRGGKLKRIFKRVLRYLRVPGTINLIVLGWAGPLLLPIEAPAGYEFSLASETDVEEISACSNRDIAARAYSTTLFRQFFRAGHRCAVVRARGEMIGHLWAFKDEYIITLDDYRYTRLTIALETTSIFTGNAYIAPRHRDHGVFRQLKLYLMHQHARGTRFYAWVDELNGASLAANRVLGFEPLAVLRFGGSETQRQLSLQTFNSDEWLALDRPWPVLRIAENRLLIETATTSS